MNLDKLQETILLQAEVMEVKTIRMRGSGKV